MNRPRPFRSRCPLCAWRSAHAWESVALADGATTHHLLVRHGISVAKISELIGRTPPLYVTAKKKEATA